LEMRGVEVEGEGLCVVALQAEAALPREEADVRVERVWPPGGVDDHVDDSGGPRPASLLVPGLGRAVAPAPRSGSPGRLLDAAGDVVAGIEDLHLRDMGGELAARGDGIHRPHLRATQTAPQRAELTDGAESGDEDPRVRVDARRDDALVGDGPERPDRGRRRIRSGRRRTTSVWCTTPCDVYVP